MGFTVMRMAHTPPNLLLNHSCAHATAPFHLIHVFYASFPSHFWPWPSHSLTSSSIISFTPISIHKFITTRTHASTLHDHIISSLHHTTHLPIPVTLFAAKSIHPFSHHFTPPSLHAYMGPIPITWMRGGGAFRWGHQWVSLWYSEGVRYACCLGFSYKINSSRVHPEVRDSWCNAIHWGLTRLNLRALLVNTPILTEDSLMGAYDKKNWILLHDADVRCVLWPRNPDDGGSIVRDLRISTMITWRLLWWAARCSVEFQEWRIPGRAKLCLYSFGSETASESPSIVIAACWCSPLTDSSLWRYGWWFRRVRDFRRDLLSSSSVFYCKWVGKDIGAEEDSEKLWYMVQKSCMKQNNCEDLRESIHSYSASLVHHIMIFTLLDPKPSIPVLGGADSFLL